MFSPTVIAWFVVGFAITLSANILDNRGRSPVGYIISSAFVGIVAGGIAWWNMAVLSPWFVSTWLMCFVIAAMAIFLVSLVAGRLASLSFLATLATFVLFIVGWILSSAPIFHAERYAALMKPEIKERNVAITLVDQSQARLVTDELARKRAAEIIASAAEDGLGSRVSLGEEWGNKVGNTFFWVMPLEHSSVFKYFSNGTTPGFIAVAQMNEMNTVFKQDKPLKISISAAFDNNVYRHLFNAGLKEYSMGTAIFQVDDEWNPYWMVPLYEPRVGMGGFFPVAWSLVNAMTGEIVTYDDVSKVPAWVDRLFEQDNIKERFDDWGCYKAGAWECLVSGNNVIVSAPGINVTLDAAHAIIYYSGTQFQANQGDGATSGFFVSNARTGKTDFFNRAGITEAAAKSVMNGAYADFEGYHAADAVPLTLEGKHDVFFSVIVDGSGSRKAYALVSQYNRNIFGKGNSVQEAISDFMRSMHRSSRDAGLGNVVAAEMTLKGRVVTITPVQQNGRTSFYITLDTTPGKIVEVSEEKIGEVVATKPGDAVSMKVENIEPSVIFASEFDNLDFKLVEGPVTVSTEAPAAEETK